MCFNPSPERRVPSPNRYMSFARFCFCKNNKRTIIIKGVNVNICMSLVHYVIVQGLGVTRDWNSAAHDNSQFVSCVHLRNTSHMTLGLLSLMLHTCCEKAMIPANNCLLGGCSACRSRAPSSTRRRRPSSSTTTASTSTAPCTPWTAPATTCSASTRASRRGRTGACSRSRTTTPTYYNGKDSPAREPSWSALCVSLFYVIDTGSTGSRARHHVTSWGVPIYTPQ